MKFWALKDEQLVCERVHAITKMNPYLAFLCAEGSGAIQEELESDIIKYIDNRMEQNITSKRQFSSFLLVKLKHGQYEDCWKLFYKFGQSMLDHMSVTEIINGLIDNEKDWAGLVVFYTGLQKCKRNLEKYFLELMEENDLFFKLTDSNKMYFDTSVAYTLQERDFRSLRLYFRNEGVLQKLFCFRECYQGWAYLPYVFEDDFFNLALEEKSNAEIFLMTEYITDILGIENKLYSKMIPDNQPASDEDVAYAKSIFEKYIREHN